MMVDGPKSSALGDNLVYFKVDKPLYDIKKKRVTFKVIPLTPDIITETNFRAVDLKAHKLQMDLLQ
jgi:hypothetical protein